MVRKKLGRGRKNRCRFLHQGRLPRAAFVDNKDVPAEQDVQPARASSSAASASETCAAFQRASKTRSSVPVAWPYAVVEGGIPFS